MDKTTSPVSDSQEQTQAPKNADAWAAFASKPAAAEEHTSVPGTAAPEQPQTSALPASTQDLQAQLREAQEQLLATSRRLQQLEEAARAAGLATGQPAAQAAPATGMQAGVPQANEPEAQAAPDFGAHESAQAGAFEQADEADKQEDVFVAPGAESDASGKRKADKKQPEGPAVHNSVFRQLAAAAPLTLLVLLAFFCWAPMLMGDLACPEEAANLKVLSGMSGLDLLPHAGSASLLPVYAWFAWGISLIPLPAAATICGPLLSYLGAAVALLGLCIFCGGLRLGKNVMLGSGLMLLSLPLFMSMANFVGPIPFACGLSLAAMGLLARSWMKNFDVPGMVLGNALAAAAALSGGLYYGLVPVLAGMLFALWRGNVQRLRNSDALIGFVCFVVLLLLWMSALILFGGSDITTDMLFAALFGTPSTQSLLSRIVLGLCAFLPFLVIVISISWPRFLANAVRSRSNSPENAAGFAWMALILALLLSACAASAFDVFLAVCLMTVLATRALLNLGTMGTKFFFLLVSILLLLVTLAGLSVTVPFVGEIFLPLAAQFGLTIPASAQPVLAAFAQGDIFTTVIIPLLPLLSALVIMHVAWRSRTAAAPLLVTAVTCVVMAQPFALLMTPVMASVPALKLEKAASIVPSLGAPVTKAAPAAKPEAPKTPAVAAPEAKTETVAPAVTTPAAKPEAAAPAAKTEAAKPDAAASEAKTEAAKPETAAPEAKPEAAAPAAKTEAAKPETVAPEAQPEAAAPATKTEAAKPEAAVPEAKPEAAKPETAAPEAQPEAAAPETAPEAKPEAAKSEAAAS